MTKKIVLSVFIVIGIVLATFTALSGVGTLLIGGPGSAGGDPAVTWFAPLFLMPVGLIGVGLVLAGSLVGKKRRALVVGFTVALIVLLVLTAAVFQFSGLAQGEIEPGETIWGGVAVALSYGCALTLLVLAVLGIVVMRDILASHAAHVPAPLAS